MNVANKNKSIHMKQLIFKNWTGLRFIRLVLGIIIIVQGAVGKNAPFVIAGILFTTMALFNAGCCAGGQCASGNSNTNKTANTNKIEYEEVV